MAIYETKSITELWTIGSQSRSGVFPPIGTILETGAARTIKDHACLIIVSRADGTPYPDAYLNKAVEVSALKPYTSEPPTQPPGVPEPIPAGAFAVVVNGVTYVNAEPIVWVLQAVK